MGNQDFCTMRRAMVEAQLRPMNVNDPAVLAAMAEVPRERFVPEGCRATCYIDRPIPLVPGRALAPPVALGLMLVALAPLPTSRALVIGTGPGYSAAVLDRLVREVTAVEENEALLAVAREQLAGGDISLVEAPLAAGYPGRAPYDLILIDGAVGQVPDAIVAQLAPDGRLACALLEHGLTRIALGRRQAGAFGLFPFVDCEVPMLPGFERPRGFSF